MKRVVLAALVLFLFAELPVFAQPEGENKTGEHSNMAVWGWLNFALLAGGLGYVIRKNAGPYFATRSREIRKGMIEAEEARTEAEAKVAEVDQRLASLEAEIEALRRDARQEAEAEAERIQREAAGEMAKIQMRLAEEIAAAGKGARLELRRHAAEVALGLAEQKILARMSPEIQDRLVKSFVTHLDRPAFPVQSI